ncbi:hypothetical protein VNO77_32230 [Canavalia gladiata]|uniref:Transmembrane protein n=1 Tax=Canavalia gladiata TaxID=3824 RepID=A0AAN9KSK9_CANGL
MARPLLSSAMHNLPFCSIPMSLFFAVLAVFCVFSVISFLCGSGKIKKLHIETEEGAARSKEHRLISKLNSKLNNRAISMVKMLSWKKEGTEGEREEEGEGEGNYSDQDQEALWRKNILMGERCRPLSFSGKIENHSQWKNAS